MRINQKCARSSMDRITDSGSVDWGSTPHGHTERLPSRFSYTLAHQQITSHYLNFKHTTQIHIWKFISAYIREIPLNSVYLCLFFVFLFWGAKSDTKNIT